MQAKFDQQIASFATQTKNKKTAATPASSSNSSGGTHCSKKDPYRVAAWRSIKKEDSVAVNGKEYHWCTGDHYSGGKKYNGMYADQKSGDHDAWCKNLDDRRAANSSGNKMLSKTPAPAAAAPTQKLALNIKL
jgi:hypothetical protein